MITETLKVSRSDTMAGMTLFLISRTPLSQDWQQLYPHMDTSHLGVAVTSGKLISSTSRTTPSHTLGTHLIQVHHNYKISV